MICGFCDVLIDSLAQTVGALWPELPQKPKI